MPIRGWSWILVMSCPVVVSGFYSCSSSSSSSSSNSNCLLEAIDSLWRCIVYSTASLKVVIRFILGIAGASSSFSSFNPAITLALSCAFLARLTLLAMALTLYSSCSLCFSSTWLYASANTARITCSRTKEPTTTREMLKNIAIHVMFESIKLYIIFVHPSSVIIWKTVSMALGRESKWINP